MHGLCVCVDDLDTGSKPEVEDVTPAVAVAAIDIMPVADIRPVAAPRPVAEPRPVVEPIAVVEPRPVVDPRPVIPVVDPKPVVVDAKQVSRIHLGPPVPVTFGNTGISVF